MTSFKTRIREASSGKSKIILANDFNNFDTYKLENKTIENIKNLGKYLCAIKLNLHLILPLGLKELTRINRAVHDAGLQSIADIKLNDIGNTNKIVTELLWHTGFDAVIVNPIMGRENLKKIINSAHKENQGVITLVHMSSPESKLAYDVKVKGNNKKNSAKLYELFLNWSTSLFADGIIVGATVPKIIKLCRKKVQGMCDIYSPGIGTQGGSAQKSMASGADYLIVGRTILKAKDPQEKAKKLQQLSLVY